MHPVSPGVKPCEYESRACRRLEFFAPDITFTPQDIEQRVRLNVKQQYQFAVRRETVKRMQGHSRGSGGTMSRPSITWVTNHLLASPTHGQDPTRDSPGRDRTSDRGCSPPSCCAAAS